MFVFFHSVVVVVDAVALVVAFRFGSNVIYVDGFKGLRKSFLADLICLNREKKIHSFFSRKRR
jgi:hypothetical protein